MVQFTICLFFFVPPSENPPYLQVFQCRIFLEIACASLPSVLEIPNGNTGSLCPSVAWYGIGTGSDMGTEGRVSVAGAVGICMGQC